jgi:hypothetical protein
VAFLVLLPPQLKFLSMTMTCSLQRWIPLPPLSINPRKREGRASWQRALLLLLLLLLLTQMTSRRRFLPLQSESESLRSLAVQWTPLLKARPPQPPPALRLKTRRTPMPQRQPPPVSPRLEAGGRAVGGGAAGAAVER